MLVPRSLGQTSRIDQRSFRCSQRFVQFGRISWSCHLNCPNSGASSGKPYCRSLSCREVHLQLCGLSFFLRPVDIFDNVLAVQLVVIWQHIGVGHVQYLESEHPCLLLLIHKLRVGKLHKPVVIVEDGVIDAVWAIRPYVG